VTTLKPFRTSFAALSVMLAGLALFSTGAGMLAVMAAGIALWGLGYAAINSMQQARIVTVKADLASASVALNTSGNYVGQATGSALGGVLLALGLPHAPGYVAVVLMTTALGVLALTRKKADA
jgi:MFS transporter, DHA1 family, inner membrane transport protein